MKNMPVWIIDFARGLPTEGLRLFYGGTVILDSEEKFGFSKAFFSRITEEVHRHSELYAPVDMFLLEAVLSSSDYNDFKSRFNPNISVSFLRSRMRRQ